MTATRAALIEGAITALRETGFAGASARQIARRADCNQALIFYHFGSVRDLLLAALDEISSRRMSAYREELERAATLPDLVRAARSVFARDLELGYAGVLLELINAAHTDAEMARHVSARLAPWREIAAETAQRVLGSTAAAALMPVPEAAHAVVAGLLGLEMLALLDGDQEPALALFDRAARAASLLAPVLRT